MYSNNKIQIKNDMNTSLTSNDIKYNYDDVYTSNLINQDLNGQLLNNKNSKFENLKYQAFKNNYENDQNYGSSNRTLINNIQQNQANTNSKNLDNSKSQYNIIDNDNLNNNNNNNNDNKNNQPKIKITRVVIDSANRVTIPKNIIDKTIITLPSNPLYFVSGSNILTVYQPNNNFAVNDNIIIQGVLAQTIYLNPNSLSLISGTTYIKINQTGQNLIFNFLSPAYIKISGIVGTTNASYVGNVPINSINGIQQIYYSINGSNNRSNDYYYINVNVTINANVIYDAESPFNITPLSICGININNINANYPLNALQNNGYQTITSILIDSVTNIQYGYQITLNQNANITTQYSYTNTTTNATVTKNFTLGTNIYDLMNTYPTYKMTTNTSTNNITVAKILNAIDGYPDQNYYKISLRKTFYNVNKIRLVDSEIPNTDNLIKSQPTNVQNNLFYWQILQDGNAMYCASLTSGSYTIDTFITELTNVINKQPRQNLNPYVTYNYSEGNVTGYINKYNNTFITINPSTNIFSIIMYSQITLNSPLLLSTTIYSDGYSRLIVLHPNHLLSVGDQITITNALATQGIPSSIINGTFIIYQVDNSNTYQVTLPIYNKLSNVGKTYGGVAVVIQYPLSFRLLFDKQNTIGKILGFQNIGSSYAITAYAKTITNQSGYVIDLTTNSVGLQNYDNNTINFSGKSYILMCCPIFSNSINSIGTVNNIFAKLLLSGPANSIIYNQHVQICEEPPEIIKSLSEFEVIFVNPDGTSVYFNNIDHSYTLEIFENIDAK